MRADASDVADGDIPLAALMRETAATTVDAPPQPPHTMQRAPDARQRSTKKLPTGRKKKPPTGRFSQKSTPARLRFILDCLAEGDTIILATTKAGIHRNTPGYWRKRSAAGDAGYMIMWRGWRAPFHEHFEAAMQTGRAKLIVAMFKRAHGYDKILKFRGRVVYKIDEFMWDLGFRGPDAYLKDENGNPVPETVPRKDKKAIKWLLARFFPDVYGKHPKSDVPQQGGGLLIVGMPEPKR